MRRSAPTASSIGRGPSPPFPNTIPWQSSWDATSRTPRASSSSASPSARATWPDRWPRRTPCRRDSTGESSSQTTRPQDGTPRRSLRRWRSSSNPSKARTFCSPAIPRSTRARRSCRPLSPDSSDGRPSRASRRSPRPPTGMKLRRTFPAGAARSPFPAPSSSPLPRTPWPPRFRP